jgi:hypothetical protein
MCKRDLQWTKLHLIVTIVVIAKTDLENYHPSTGSPALSLSYVAGMKVDFAFESCSTYRQAWTTEQVVSTRETVWGRDRGSSVFPREVCTKPGCPGHSAPCLHGTTGPPSRNISISATVLQATLETRLLNDFTALIFRSLEFIRIIFNNSARTAKRTQHFTVPRINCLILFKEVLADYSKNHMKPINTMLATCRITDC